MTNPKIVRNEEPVDVFAEMAAANNAVKMGRVALQDADAAVIAAQESLADAEALRGTTVAQQNANQQRFDQASAAVRQTGADDTDWAGA